MSDERVVIIGGSHGAAQVAASLRQEGWTGKISLVSAEAVIPYHRPPLSKAYLAGGKHPDEIFIRPANFYDTANVELVLGMRVVAIDRNEKSIELANGVRISYDKLALTTGASARKLTLPGDHLPGVLYLREMKDVDRIREFAGRGRRAVIIGGGYIGLEAAASLRNLGVHVTIVEAFSRVLQRVTVTEISEFYTRIHREEGVEILTGVTATSINGNLQVESVSCGDGLQVKADLVIVGIGVRPEISLAEDAGLEINDGIRVDEFARTSDHNILAAGDCTSHCNPIYQRFIRLESVQNATEQAKTAAKTICGKLEPYRALPWFWSDQYDVKLQIAGLSQGYDRIVIRGEWKAGRSFAVFYFKERKFLAVDAINRPKEFMLSRRLLTDGHSPDPERLHDEALPVRDLLIA
ncbi:FAD/NAD(P)-binding oxidoreductase [Paraburkholderia sp. BL17N1]|uniref:NAD(P)/FAD-dependent oxidoreductase n=1 Tax=Paraburkholderia sp. BL17N1 TaxID=1938798 RepID=UPI000EB38C59|nr:FAD/NAD(P)-binding oxidoreductase [Paraburkholderia sp. BL17N1]RKR31298.1 3-phenylpropionate/trans-cinnamate dioxygenase ferredoxin reductase subunit [Paraburkholderia sp. BL17N1]